MDQEKRKGDIPIPDNLDDVLNKAQLRALPGIKLSGWEIRFMRKPLFQDPVLVLYKPRDKRTGILDEDGKLSIQGNIKVRDKESLDQTPPSDDPRPRRNGRFLPIHTFARCTSIRGVAVE